MPGSVEIEYRDRIAILRLTNPPVNGLSFSVRNELETKFSLVQSRSDVAGIIIAGHGRMFCAGADISEFGQPTPRGTAFLPGVIDNIEASSKPVIAAIHGVAAGGGLEVALGCHERLVLPGTRLGLPEVTLGIVPGAGGTQRLPRLIGVEAALDVIVTGRLLNATEALTLGIVDAIVEGDLVEAAATRIQELVDSKLPFRRASTLDAKLIEAQGQPELFDAYRTKIAKRARGFDAPYACIACVQAALTVPYAEAAKKEREIFSQLVTSDQSRAQRHVFFSEREVAKITDVPKDTPSRPVTAAAVVGCGTMGGGIVMNFANAGIPVTVLETSKTNLDRGMDIVRNRYRDAVTKGRLSTSERDERLARISTTLDYEEIAKADFVVEAVFEDLELKKHVFATLDQACKPDAVLASNTSTLNIDELAAVTSRPDKVIGTHFFSPANVMKLMENVRGTATSVETIATTMALSKRLRKIGVLVGVCDGFVGNRMLYAYRRQADFLLEEGATPQQIDQVFYDFGFPMGPFQMADLAGLDIGWSVRQQQASARPRHLRYSPLADRICEMGRFGQKTGAGWYQYAPGSRTATPDPIIDTLIRDVSEELGIARQPILDTDVIPRCLYPLVNEGAKILDEGIATRASDIDVIWIHGYGFPRFRGGPMFWANTIGLRAVYDMMSRLYDLHGEWFQPSSLLKQLASHNKSFGD